MDAELAKKALKNASLNVKNKRNNFANRSWKSVYKQYF